MIRNREWCTEGQKCGKGFSSSWGLCFLEDKRWLVEADILQTTFSFMVFWLKFYWHVFLTMRQQSATIHDLKQSKTQLLTHVWVTKPHCVNHTAFLLWFSGKIKLVLLMAVTNFRRVHVWVAGQSYCPARNRRRNYLRTSPDNEQTH